MTDEELSISQNVASIKVSFQVVQILQPYEHELLEIPDHYGVTYKSCGTPPTVL